MDFIGGAVRILSSVGEFILGLLILARLAQLNPYNPLLYPLLRALGPFLHPFRRLLPSLGSRVDLAEILLLLLLGGAPQLLLGTPLPVGSALAWTGLETLSSLINLMFLAILLAVVKSWVAPGGQHPAADLIDGISSLILHPIRSLIGARTLDLSPLLAVILLVLVDMQLNAMQASLLRLAASQ